MTTERVLKAPREPFIKLTFMTHYYYSLLQHLPKVFSIVFSFLSVISLLHSAMKDKTRSCLYFGINTASINSYSR